MTAEAKPLSIGVGVHVEIELIDERGGREAMAFDIVREKNADMTRDLLAASTPLAKAIRGLQAGSEVPYVMGDIRRVRVLSVRRAETGDLEDVREQRAAALRKALNAAQRTDAEVFAASFDGKWGDYDMSDVPQE